MMNTQRRHSPADPGQRALAHWAMAQREAGLAPAPVQELEPQRGGIIEGYLAHWGHFNQHNERFIRGAFAKAIRERLLEPAQARIEFNVYHAGGFFTSMTPDTHAGVPLELIEDERGLRAVTRVVGHDSTEAGRRIWALITEGALTGFSIEFNPMRSTFQLLDPEQYRLEELGSPEMADWLLPCVGREVALTGYALVPQPSDDEARVDQIRSVLRHMGRVQVPGHTFTSTPEDNMKNKAAAAPPAANRAQEGCDPEKMPREEPATEEGAAPEQSDMGARMDAMEERMGAYEARMQAMEDRMGPPPKDDDEEPEEAAPPKEEDARGALEFGAALPVGSTLTLTAEDAGWLYDLHRAAPERFAAIKARLVAPSQSAAPAEQPKARTNPWSQPAEQPAEQPQAETDAELRARALREAGGDKVKAHQIYKRLKGL